MEKKHSENFIVDIRYIGARLHFVQKQISVIHIQKNLTYINMTLKEI